MMHVNVTELRQHLPSYLDRVQLGEEIEITSHGKLIARIVPVRDEAAAALERLIALRGQCALGDVMSPSGEQWDAEYGRV